MMKTQRLRPGVLEDTRRAAGFVALSRVTRLRPIGPHSMPMRRAVLPAAFLFAAALAFPPGAPGQTGKRYPEPRGRVNDFAGVLRSAEARQLEAVLADLSRRAEAEVAVVTMRRVEAGDVKTAAVELFEQWGVGPAKTDRGLLMLVSMEDRRVEVEVGYGLEEVLPDGKVGRILDRHVIPYFKAGDISAGVVRGALTFAAVIAEDAGVPLGAESVGAAAAARAPAPAGPLAAVLRILFLIVMAALFVRNPLLFLLFLGAGGGRGAGGFGGGGFGAGGFGGFGGGLSGGAGTGRSW